MSFIPAGIINEEIPDLPNLEERYPNPTEQIKTTYDFLKEEAVNEYSKALNPSNTPLEKCQHIVELALSLQKLDKHVEQFDSSGAYNEYVYHTELGSVMSSREYGFNDRGHLEILPEDFAINLIYFSVDNLALVNKEGSHDDGDNILQDSVQKVERVLSEEGYSTEDYKIFHNKGPDFTVILKNAEEEQVLKVVEKINNSDLETAERLGLVFEPKLVAGAMSRASALETYNKLKDTLENIPGSSYFFEGDLARRFVTTTLINSFEMAREAEVGKSLMETLINSEVSQPDKESFYQMYLRRYFQGESTVNFNSLINQVKAGKSDELLSDIWDTARNKIVLGMTAEGNVDEVVSKAALVFNKVNTVSNEKQAEEVIKALETKSSEESRKSCESLKRIHEIYTTPEKENIKKLDSFYEDIVSQMEDYQPEKFISTVLEFRNTLLDLKIPSRLSVRIGKKEVFIPEMLDSVLEDKTVINTEDSESLKTLLNATRNLMAEIISTNKMEHDPITGLIKRSEFYERVHPAVIRALLGGWNAEMIFKDVDFLKYTNELGGRESGNAVLEMLSYAMEKAKQTITNLKDSRGRELFYCDVARYAGDEFTAFITSPSENVKVAMLPQEIKSYFEEQGINEVSAKDIYYYIVNLELSKDRVTGSSKASDLFIEQYVRFGMGSCSIEQGLYLLKNLVVTGAVFSDEDSKRMNEVMKNLELYRSGNRYADQDLEFLAANLASVMVRVSDKIVDLNKPYSRFAYLYSMFKELAENPNLDKKSSMEWKAFNTLLVYSRKALESTNFEKFSINLEDLGGEGASSVFHQLFEYVSSQIGNMPLTPEKYHELFGDTKEVGDIDLTYSIAYADVLEKMTRAKQTA